MGHKRVGDMKHSEFPALACAVEFFFPRFRGELRWGHAVLRGWGVSREIKHTVPLGRGAAALVATQLQQEQAALLRKRTDIERRVQGGEKHPWAASPEAGVLSCPTCHRVACRCREPFSAKTQRLSAEPSSDDNGGPWMLC